MWLTRVTLPLHLRGLVHVYHCNLRAIICATETQTDGTINKSQTIHWSLWLLYKHHLRPWVSPLCKGQIKQRACLVCTVNDVNWGFDHPQIIISWQSLMPCALHLGSVCHLHRALCMAAIVSTWRLQYLSPHKITYLPNLSLTLTPSFCMSPNKVYMHGCCCR